MPGLPRISVRSCGGIRRLESLVRRPHAGANHDIDLLSPGPDRSRDWWPGHTRRQHTWIAGQKVGNVFASAGSGRGRSGQLTRTRPTGSPRVDPATSRSAASGIGEDRTAAFVKRNADLGQAQSPGRTLDQAHAETRLETGNAAAHTRLRQVHRARRCRETLVLDDGCKELNVVQVVHGPRLGTVEARR